MSMELVGLILDGLVLLFLAATIFFAIRLTASINAFRRGRKELDKLVTDLSRNIEKAELAITGLKNSAKDSGRDLQALLNEAKSLSDELQIMTNAGDNLAGRLERLAERNRETVERIEKTAPAAPSGLATSDLRRVQEHKRAMTGPAFNIRDKEYESGEKEPDLPPEDDFPDEGAGHSKAERELLEAIRKGVKTKGGRS